MSIGARIGSALLLSGLVWVSSAPVRAQTTWTDPPVREGGAGTEAAPAAKPAARPNGQDADRTKTEPATPRRATAEPSRQVAPIRRRAARTGIAVRREAGGRVSRTLPPDGVTAPPPRRIAMRRAPERPLSRGVRRMAGGFGPEARLAGGAYPPSARRAGWDDLLGGERARRIERARAAGYLVMRARDVVYPDGFVLRTLHPIDPMGEDGFD